MKTSAMGFLMAQEVSYLDRLLLAPEKPFIGVLGGAKVSDPIALIEPQISRVDFLLIGGAMAYSFLRTLGRETGKSMVESDYLTMAADLIEMAEDRLILPVDHVIAQSVSNDVGSSISGVDIKPNEMALDIGPRTQKLFREHILEARTVV